MDIADINKKEAENYLSVTAEGLGFMQRDPTFAQYLSQTRTNLSPGVRALAAITAEMTDALRNGSGPSIGRLQAYQTVLEEARGNGNGNL